MCNLYSMTTSLEAFRAFVKAFEIEENWKRNWPSMPGIFPDYAAPIIRNSPTGPLLTTARWGMPSSSQAIFENAKKRARKLEEKGKSVNFPELLKNEPDGGTTNIRNVSSPHWRPWLEVANRCVVPVTSFAEPELQSDGSRPPAWFAKDEARPLMFFAGIYTLGWTGVRKIKTGMETADLFGFLTCQPNADVAGTHEKAMPVILTTSDEVEAWLTAPANDVPKLQRPLPDGALKIVARGERRGDPPDVAADAGNWLALS